MVDVVIVFVVVVIYSHYHHYYYTVFVTSMSKVKIEGVGGVWTGAGFGNSKPYWGSVDCLLNTAGQAATFKCRISNKSAWTKMRLATI